MQKESNANRNNMTKMKILESKQTLQLLYEPSQNLITLLKQQGLVVNLIWKVKAIQALGSCVDRFFVPKES